MEVKDYFILLFAFMFFGAWLGLRFNKKCLINQLSKHFLKVGVNNHD